MEALDIFQGAVFENGITKNELITYHPLSTQFSNNAEVRFLIQNQQVLAKISDSYIYIEGKITNVKKDKPFKLSNNSFLHLFQEVRFLLNEHLISSVREPGLVSLARGLLCLNDKQTKALTIAGFDISGAESTIYNKTTNTFQTIIPLRFMFSLFEDYQKVFVNLRQELILIRAKNDVNAYVGEADITFDISKITWRVPHLSVDNNLQLQLLKGIKNEKRLVDVPHRQWTLHILPEVKDTRQINWRVTNFPRFQKPRFIIVAFQSDRKDNPGKDVSEFDHCNITSLRAYLNDVCFPYETFETDFSKNNWVHYYNKYSTFQELYLSKNYGEPLLTYNQFKNQPLFVINCREQNTAIASTIYDLKIEIEVGENIPHNTNIYAFVVSDNLIQYNPMTEALYKTIE